MQPVVVTGGAGFIGSEVIRQLVRSAERVVNVDCLTYAANLESLVEVEGSDWYHFEQADVCDARAIREVFRRYSPRAVIHLAAESHVDRSIDRPAEFIRTNVVGTCTLLEQALEYWRGLDATARGQFRFLHVSTDEVYGSLGPTGAFNEETRYDPRSPYSASKAGADHLARAWFHTYGLPVLLTNCSNNYGPFQFPEKLIPLMIINALSGEPLPIYGKGDNVRDWIHVADHVHALRLIADRARPGTSYNIGSSTEKRNIEVVETICAILEELNLDSPHRPYRELITFVQDRPGHDYRYAIDARRLVQDLDWRPLETFETGIAKTVRWYLEHREWWERIRSGRYLTEQPGPDPTAARI